MTNVRIIQESLDYIENHLQTEITAAELASKAGFSVYHFYRLFQAETGMPVMQYILRRRLLLHRLLGHREAPRRLLHILLGSCILLTHVLRKSRLTESGTGRLLHGLLRERLPLEKWRYCDCGYKKKH